MSGVHELAFGLGNAAVLPFWLLMIAAPRWRWTERIVRSWWIAAVPAVAYGVLVVPQLPTLLPLLAKPTLEQIAPLLGTPAAATIAWLHFLTFDLFVGRSVFLDAKERGLGWWVTSPVLLTVLMVGPAGFLVYLLVRGAFGLRAAGSAT